MVCREAPLRHPVPYSLFPVPYSLRAMVCPEPPSSSPAAAAHILRTSTGVSRMPAVKPFPSTCLPLSNFPLPRDPGLNVRDDAQITCTVSTIRPGDLHARRIATLTVREGRSGRIRACALRGLVSLSASAKRPCQRGPASPRSVRAIPSCQSSEILDQHRVGRFRAAREGQATVAGPVEPVSTINLV